MATAFRKDYVVREPHAAHSHIFEDPGTYCGKHVDDRWKSLSDIPFRGSIDPAKQSPVYWTVGCSECRLRWNRSHGR